MHFDNPYFLDLFSVKKKKGAAIRRPFHAIFSLLL
jgi:hypothetical protein